jgi:hypothetical protein
VHERSMSVPPDQITLDTKIRICKLTTHSLLFENLHYEFCNTMLELSDTPGKRTVHKTDKIDERNLSLHQTREVFSVFKAVYHHLVHESC